MCITASISIRLYKKPIIVVIHITGAVGIQDLLIGFQHQASLGIEDIRPAGSPEHFTDGYDRVFAVGYEYSFRRVYRSFSVFETAAASCSFWICIVVPVYVRIYEPGTEAPGETVGFIDRRYFDTGMVCLVA